MRFLHSQVETHAGASVVLPRTSASTERKRTRVTEGGGEEGKEKTDLFLGDTRPQLPAVCRTRGGQQGSCSAQQAAQGSAVGMTLQPRRRAEPSGPAACFVPISFPFK